MRARGWFFVICAMVCEVSYASFHRAAGPLINGISGTIVLSFTACITALLFFALFKIFGAVEFFGDSDLSIRGVKYAMAVGASACGIDIFTLAAYGQGMKLSIAGPLILGGGIGLTPLIGYLIFKEKISFYQAFGILLILIGSIALLRLEK